jgi:membrane protein DedA with SNARE-associated domain
MGGMRDDIGLTPGDAVMHLPLVTSSGQHAQEWFVVALRHYGYFALFGLIAAQDLGLPTVVPGAVVLVCAGYLASVHMLNPFLSGLVAAVAALAGSSVVFAVARLAGSTFLAPLRRFLRLDPKRHSQVDAFLARWGLAAWLALRYIPGFRAALALVSGFSTMSYTRFAMLTSLAAGIWAYSFILVGVLVGSHWRAATGAARVSTLLSLAACLVAVVVVVSWRIARAHVRQQAA